MFTEDDLLPLSALQHLQFCPRQWGLIHLEQVWVENVLTMQGRILHERVHQEQAETRGAVRTVRSLRIHSLSLGLVGQADVVEFHQSKTGIALPGLEGLWQPFPVEYKRGKPKIGPCDEVQLCAQALCLEEMLEVAIGEGAFFYGQPRHRHPLALTADLRQRTIDLTRQMHELFRQGKTPRANYSSRCRSCSLYEQCRPKTTGPDKKIALYIQRCVQEPGGQEA